MFIVIEGIDGSGKTTQIKLLRKRLGSGFKLAKFPSSNPIGRLIRKEVLNSKTEPFLDSMLFLSDMMLEKSRFKDGNWICDRYYPSFFAYQAAQGVDVKKFSFIIDKLPKPDAIFVLLSDVRKAISRNREKKRSKYETASFLRKAQDNYKKFRRLFKAKTIYIDSSLSPEEVSKIILKEVSRL